jgi:hypothetical protein
LLLGDGFRVLHKRDHHLGQHKAKREYTFGKHMSKGRFDKEALKKKYLHKAKIKDRAFLAYLSDLDHDSTCSSSSDEELERWVEDKLNGLSFFADTTGGLYTRALGEDEVGSGDKDIGDDSTS